MTQKRGIVNAQQKSRYGSVPYRLFFIGITAFGLHRYQNRLRKFEAFVARFFFFTFFQKGLDKAFLSWYNTTVIQRQQVPVKVAQALLPCRGATISSIYLYSVKCVFLRAVVCLGGRKIFLFQSIFGR